MGTIKGIMKFLFAFLACVSFMALANGITEDLFYAMAQASCVGLDGTGVNGYIYAVKRTQNGPLDCNQICADGSLLMQDKELVVNHYPPGECINGLKVESITSEFPKQVMKLGPRINIYQSCEMKWTNYCCCKFHL